MRAIEAFGSDTGYAADIAERAVDMADEERRRAEHSVSKSEALRAYHQRRRSEAMRAYYARRRAEAGQ